MLAKAVPFFILVYCFTSYLAVSQTGRSGMDSAIVGVWKGSSLCQDKNSACHDEIVVYHISKGQGPDTFDIAANKIVNGKEEEMGTIVCKYDRAAHRLISTSNNGLWTFNLNSGVINGTLMARGELYRVIKVTKQD